MEERRKFPRLGIDVNVVWHKIEEQGSSPDPNTDVTRDISEGGICLMVYALLKRGDRVQLELGLPTGRIIRAQGRVAWADTFQVVSKKEANRFDVGIEFTEISQDDREEIKKFVFSLF